MKLRGPLAVMIVGIALACVPSVRAADLYSNGPFAVDTDNGYAFVNQSGDSEWLTVSNSFVLTADSTLDSVTLGIGVNGDYAPESFYWNIGSTAFSTDMGGTVFVFSSTKVGEDSFGNANFSLSFSLSGLPLSAGTYWLTLSQGVSTNPGPDAYQLYWLQSTGGSSVAYQREDDGTPQSVPSESFTITGVPEPTTGALLVFGGIALFIRRRSAVRQV